jgi:hypothetical protein
MVGLFSITFHWNRLLTGALELSLLLLRDYAGEFNPMTNSWIYDNFGTGICESLRALRGYELSFTLHIKSHPFDLKFRALIYKSFMKCQLFKLLQISFSPYFELHATQC